MYDELLEQDFDWNNLTIDNIASDEVIEALGDPEIDKIAYAQNKVKLFKRAKDLKCLGIVKDFVRLLEGGTSKQIANAAQLPPQDDTQHYVVADLGQGTTALCSGSWEVDYTGVWQFNFYGRKIYACRKPVIITKKLININSEKYKYELTFKDQRGRLKHLSFPCAWLLNANKVQGLADYGISMTSTEAKHFVDYLSEFVGNNEIPTASSTDKLGWLGHDFVPYNNTVTFDAEAQYQELYSTVMKHSGASEAWVDYMQELRATNRPEIFISLAASFASPLLPLLNALPFICNLYGTTGKGKTVCLYLAASVWGKPNLFISDSKNTMVANEVRLSTLNHLPMLLDDFSQISANKFVSISDIIYSLCSGMGKSRSNKELTLNEQKRWQCAILTNMERPLVEDNAKGGSINRVLDFQIGATAIFKDGNRVVSFLDDNYGYAGEDFITELIKLREKDPDYIKDRYRYWTNEIYNNYGKGHSLSDKQVASLAALFLGDELAEKFIFKDGLGMCKNPMEYVSQLKDQAEVDEGQRGFEFVLQCVMRDINMFEPQNKDIDDNTYHGKVGGNIEELNTGEHVLNILTEQFRVYMREGNFSEKITLDWVANKGYLYGYEKGKRKVSRKTIIRNYSPYCYSIIIDKKTSKEQFIDASNEELPFD